MTPESIHQYWHSPELPNEVVASQQSLKSLNPSWRATMWSQHGAADFIQRHFGDGVAEVFAKCKIPAMQSDLFRYCVLLREGGVYLDSDAIAHLPFYQWLDPAADITLPITNIADPAKPGLGNGFIASAAGNPLLAFALGQCVHNVLRETENNIARVTGPRTLHCALKFRRNCNPQLIDPRDNYLDNFNLVIENPAGHWSQRQQTETIFLGLSGAATIESEDALRCSLGLVTDPLADGIVQDIALGYRYAEFERLVAAGRDTRQSLTALLESGENFNFEPLRDCFEGSVGMDFEAYDERVKGWRIALLNEQIRRFDVNLDRLMTSVTDADALPGASSELGLGSPGLWFHAAKRLEALNYSDLAAQAIRRALNTLNYDRDIFTVAARIFCNSQRNQEAQDCALEVLQRDKDNTAALHYLARAYEQDERLDLARQAAESLVAVTNSEAAYLQLIRVLCRLRQSEDAREMALEAKVLFPQSMELNRLLEEVV